MFKEWYISTIPRDGYKKINHGELIKNFLDQNSKAEFPRSDIRFFIELIIPNDFYLGCFLLNSFFSNEKRIIDTLDEYRHDLFMMRSLIFMIGHIQEYKPDHENIDLEIFLYRNINISIFEECNFYKNCIPHLGMGTFHFLCACHQSKEIDPRLINLKWFFSPWSLDKIKKFLPREKYTHYLGKLMKFNIIEETLKYNNRSFVKKFRNIIRSKFQSRKVYSHFVMRSILLPKICL